MAYFGRSELYVERYLSWPRHVEVQVLGDATGNILWLGDRDCSCQRRHQKLVEESPSPGIPADVRVAMGEAAVEVARACDYVNAGTIEFLYQDGEFYFLEMNTRLQVEHPVTELVTGIDLVEWQLRIASGDALTFGQEDIKSQGHAIEVRINAEEPSAGFAPSPGTISRFDVPAGPGIRVDAGYAAADAVNQHYDNLIAKLIVFGSDRESARRRVLRALHETRIDGVATTIPAHVAIMSSPEFANAEHSTKWVDERLDLSTIAPAVTGPTAGQGSEAATTRSLFVEVDGRRHAITVWGEGLVGFASPSTDAAVAPKQPTAGLSPWDPSAPVLHAPGALVSPLQGVIIKVMVELGDSVAAGDTLFLLESMKMENSINAEISGVVRELHASAGDMVQPGEVLAVVE
jgi:acetyl-CoA/propionyl-CoA carboxylase biotin carboxyl carrier protein